MAGWNFRFRSTKRSRSPVSQHGVYGLRTLASGGETPKAYIVAIHGLMGNSVETWTHEDGTLWLKDTLPPNLPDVRILSFGYDNRIFAESQNQFTDVARNLLDELKICRTAQNKGKPIIFICHDLGSIVFKKSIALALENGGLYEDITQSAKHAMFLGAPHAESEHSTGKFLLNLGPILPERLANARSNFLDGLRGNSFEFAKTNQSFTSLSSTMGITSFYETKRTGKGPIPVMVVDAMSARIGLPKEESIPVQEDHSTICKIGAHGGGPVEGTVVGVVRRVILSESAPPESSEEPITEEQQKVLSSLFLISASNMLQNITEPADGTCDWLIKDRAYTGWMMGNSRGLLWIEGPTGYGKSVLARYLKSHLEKLESKPNVCSFFCDYNVENRDHSTAVIRMILYQLMSRRPALTRYAMSSMTADNQWL
ncbi:hypothetical protein F4677DRAFT_263568 [Hypoxylon crocopeplum]|nr:hypothetical protein F4677DRAFT_263568 [Hypoxylon crocopeplum]